MSEKRLKIGFIKILIIAVFMMIGSVSVYACDLFSKDTNKNSSEILSVIDCYQEKYFSIIKRNDLLLQLENNKTLKKDKKDLKNLYKKAEKQVTNKYYLKKYKDIQKRYAECDELTDSGMKDFAYRNYREADDLLNEVYMAVKSKISPDDFQKLVQSEKNWLKNVEDYKKVFNSMEYGTIGSLVYYDYQISMREFRTLLLMLYL